jgi:hypothetical protein
VDALPYEYSHEEANHLSFRTVGDNNSMTEEINLNDSFCGHTEKL